MNNHTESIFYLVRLAAGGMKGHLREMLLHFGRSCRINLASPAEVGLAPLAEQSGGRYFRMPLASGLSPFGDLRSFGQLLRALWSTRPALLHVHGFKAALIAGPAASIAGVPLLVTVHNFPAYGEGASLCLAGSLAVWKRTRYIAVSRALAEQLLRWGIARENITVIHNGIDAGPFTEAASERRPGQRILVGTVARLAPQKGLPVFLRAAARLAERHPEIHFTVAGEGPEREALELLSRKLKLSGRVSFPGYQADLPRLMAHMDLFVLPSLSEGLSITLLEALASGLPVVASRCGGIPEIIEDGVTGLLVPPGNEEALAQAVDKLVRDREMAGRLAETGREQVRRSFSLQTMLRHTAAVYRQMGCSFIEAG